MISVVLSLLTAIFRAIPSIASLAREALDLADRANAAEALRRKQEKDAEVDKMIDEIRNSLQTEIRKDEETEEGNAHQ